MQHDTTMPAVRLDQNLEKKVRAMARSKGLSISEFVRQALINYLANAGKSTRKPSL